MTLSVPLADSSRNVCRPCALKLVTWMELIPRKKVILESSCNDSPETHSGMFSFCVANDDGRQATREGSASLALLCGGVGWM